MRIMRIYSNIHIESSYHTCILMRGFVRFELVDLCVLNINMTSCIYVEAYVRILNILILLIVVRYSQLGGVVFSSGRVRVSP